MFIVIQEYGDKMIVDTPDGHQRTLGRISGFLASTAATLELPADRQFSLDPASATMRALRVVKTGDLVVARSLPDETLEVSGRPDLLRLYFASLDFSEDEGSSHHHPDHGDWMGSGGEGIIFECVDAEDLAE